MSGSTFQILEELEATSGSLAKREILNTHSSNSLLREVFLAAGDPERVYYINKFRLPPPAQDPGDDDEVLRGFLQEVLPRLSTREITGGEAKRVVIETFSSMSKLQQKWCERILLRNLRCGVQEATVNKVWPGLIVTFSVALAETLKSDFLPGKGLQIVDKRDVSYPVRVEPKLDGLRCLAIKKDGIVTLYTRNGTVLETLPTIRRLLEEMPHDNIVLDGEAMGGDWSESASVLMSRKNQKDDSNIVYNVFDMMTYEQWSQKDCPVPYATRGDIVQRIVSGLRSPRIVQVPHTTVSNTEQLMHYFVKCMDEGYEGVMLKKIDAPYEFGRSRNILKLKPIITYEGVITGFYEGRRGTKREGLFGGFEVTLPNRIVTRVGGGFNDAIRAQIGLEGPETWIGKIVECEAQPDPLTTDGLTEDGRMRFPVFLRVRDISDVDVSLSLLAVELTHTSTRD